MKNREAVLDALVDLFADGLYTPNAAEIARRAGLSPRSLFRYFEDSEDLNRAAIDRQLRRAAPLIDPGVPPDAPTGRKVRMVAQARVRLFDAIGPSARASRVCAHRHRVVREQLRRDRSFLRRQVATIFAPELLGTGPEVLDALDLLFSFESYDLLRAHQSHSERRTVAAIVAAANALLLVDPPPT